MSLESIGGYGGSVQQEKDRRIIGLYAVDQTLTTVSALGANDTMQGAAHALGEDVFHMFTDLMNGLTDPEEQWEVYDKAAHNPDVPKLVYDPSRVANKHGMPVGTIEHMAGRASTMIDIQQDAYAARLLRIQDRGDWGLRSADARNATHAYNTALGIQLLSIAMSTPTKQPR